jgi:hypothetical protein
MSLIYHDEAIISTTRSLKSSTSASAYLAQKQNKEAAIVKRQDETLMSMEEVLKFCYIYLSAKNGYHEQLTELSSS